jgi:hypothetical protein
MQAFSPTWISKKLIRNKPVKAITSFLPTADVKKYDHFISYQGGVKKFSQRYTPIAK